MDNLYAQMKRLKKLQKKGKKQSSRVNKMLKKQIQDLEIVDQMSQLAQKSISEVKAANIQEKLTDTIKKWKKVGLLLLALLGMGIVLNLLFRRYKKNKENCVDDSRFDFIDHVQDKQDRHFDFDNASLEELEEALLRVENDLSEVTGTLNQQA